MSPHGDRDGDERGNGRGTGARAPRAGSEGGKTAGETADRTAGVPWLAALPLALFAGLALLFGTQLLSGRDASDLPSALIGRPAPALDLPELAGVPGVAGALALPDPAGRVALVNVWASWCAPCRAEHPFIARLAADPRVSMQGIAYKDAPGASRRFLAELGNPYERIGTDEAGRAGIEWGITGVPETFVVAPDGTVRHRHRGPIGAADLPRLEAVIAEAARR